VGRILIIRGGAIGDFIHTLPILEAIRVQDPAAEVEILGYPAIAELAVGRRHASAVRRVDGAEWAPLFSPGADLGPGERDYLAGFDRVFSIWPDPDGAIQENLRRAGARDVIAVDPLPPEGESVHVVEHMARQCSRRGLPVPYLEPHLYPSERDRLWAERFLRVTGAGQRPLLGLHPGSGSAAKNWPAAGYAEVARYWKDERMGHVLVTAGPADERPLAELEDLLESEEVFLLRDEPLPRVAALLERCEAFVGNDSGILQMAAAVRTPVVGLYGPTDPRIWGPRAPRVAVLTPPDGGPDLSALPAEEVVREIRLLLRQA